MTAPPRITATRLCTFAASLIVSDGRMPSAARLTSALLSATAIFMISSMFETFSAWSALSDATRTLKDVSLWS